MASPYEWGKLEYESLFSLQSLLTDRSAPAPNIGPKLKEKTAKQLPSVKYSSYLGWLLMAYEVFDITYFVGAPFEALTIVNRKDLCAKK